MSRRSRRRRAQYQVQHSGTVRGDLSPDDPPAGAGIKQVVVLLMVAFVVTLGVMVGLRLSSDAIAVLVGVIAGVAASIPCALLLMAVTRRRQDEWEEEDGDEPGWAREYDPRHAAPPVIVVTPGNAAPQQLPAWASGQANWFPAPGYGAPSHSQRQFRVMGLDEESEYEA